MYFQLSSLQILELGILTVLFLIFIGFIRYIVLGYTLDSNNIIFLTILFVLWYFLSKTFSNTAIYVYDDRLRKI